MIVEIDRRDRFRPVRIGMTEEEFRDHVEWLELLAPDDGCTKDLRRDLDRLLPPEAEA